MKDGPIHKLLRNQLLYRLIGAFHVFHPKSLIGAQPSQLLLFVAQNYSFHLLGFRIEIRYYKNTKQPAMYYSSVTLAPEERSLK